MNLPDYHTHTSLCKHASGKPLEYLQFAEKKGLSELGVSDHCPWPAGFDSDHRMTAQEYPDYRRIIEKLQSVKSSVKVKYGLEIDYVPDRMDEVLQNISGENFDYIIGSIHYVDDFPFDDPSHRDEWKNQGKILWVWEKYIEMMKDFVENYSFDIIGHIDIPKKFGYYPENISFFHKGLETIFANCAENETAIEINTAGLRKPVKEIYPSLEILKIAKKFKVELTLGSDAHAPNLLGKNFKKALELAKVAGYRRILRFDKRKKSFISI